jgi:hypothetical protein
LVEVEEEVHERKSLLNSGKNQKIRNIAFTAVILLMVTIRYSNSYQKV